MFNFFHNLGGDRCLFTHKDLPCNGECNVKERGKGGRGNVDTWLFIPLWNGVGISL